MWPAWLGLGWLCGYRFVGIVLCHLVVFSIVLFSHLNNYITQEVRQEKRALSESRKSLKKEVAAAKEAIFQEVRY